MFYTATGEDFDERAINKKTGFIGTSARYDVYLLYEPDLDYLKNTALTLDMARGFAEGERQAAVGVCADEVSGRHPSGGAPD